MSKSLKQKLVAYALVLPAFLVVMLTVAYPIVSAVIQSFRMRRQARSHGTTTCTSSLSLRSGRIFCTHCML